MTTLQHPYAEEYHVTRTTPVAVDQLRTGDVIDLDGAPVTVEAVVHWSERLVFVDYRGGSRSGRLIRRPETLVDRHEVTP